MQRLHELDPVYHASRSNGPPFALVSVDHSDVVKVEGVSALRGVCPHLRASFVPADGPFVLPHTGSQAFASFSDMLNRSLAAFKAANDTTSE